MPMKTPQNEQPALRPLGEAVLQSLLDPKPERFVASGIKGLDDIILGAVPSEMIVVGGNPGMGKTTLVTQWLLNAANNYGKAALLSMEMGSRAIGQRMVAGLTGIPMRMLRTREWASKDQAKQAKAAAKTITQLPLMIDDRSGLDGPAIYDTIMGWKEQGVVLAGIDYLQRIRGRNDSRNALVGENVQWVKSAAKDADMPVILLSSLSRAVNARENKRPRMSDLRDSGDIEFEADTVLMFSYPEDDKHLPVRLGYIHVLKQRNGGTGDVPVKFDQPKGFFTDRRE